MVSELPGRGALKTVEQHFRDWESDAIGYGYGTGEPHTTPALRTFLSLCNEGDYGRSYCYKNLEAALGGPTAWLLISLLCKADVLEYGTSPRGGWLTKKGERLRGFVLAHTSEQLVEIICSSSMDGTECYPNHCNCGSGPCVNPFWRDEA